MVARLENAPLSLIKKSGDVPPWLVGSCGAKVEIQVTCGRSGGDGGGGGHLGCPVRVGSVRDGSMCFS